jgi:hypothetical protein
MGMGTKKDGSCTGHIWAAGFYHVKARSHLSRVLKLSNGYFCNFPIFFFRLRQTADTESVDMGA